MIVLISFSLELLRFLLFSLFIFSVSFTILSNLSNNSSIPSLLNFPKSSVCNPLTTITSFITLMFLLKLLIFSFISFAASVELAVSVAISKLLFQNLYLSFLFLFYRTPTRFLSPRSNLHCIHLIHTNFHLVSCVIPLSNSL